MRPTERFTDRVEDYARWRPGYPPEVVDLIARATRLPPHWTIADIGAGTGLAAEPFLARGHTVIGVEPNRAMREAGEARLARWPAFRSVAGTAEATTLPDQCVDLVVCAQSFHWFDADAARGEFRRILRPHGAVALLWNTRRTGASAFMRDYESLLLDHALDYQRVRHDRLGDADLERFFGGPYATARVAHGDRLDLEALTGRLLSASYTPPAGHPGREPMLRELADIFRRHARDGRVVFELDAELYVGAPAEPR